jgi:phage terminase small subunit
LVTLNPKHARFVAEYLIDQDATNAAKRAGYSAKSAHSTGFDLTQRPDVAAAIAEGLKALAERAGISAARIVEEIGRLAVGNLRDLHNSDGSVIPIHQWPDHIASCVSSVEYGTAENTLTGETYSFIKKLHLWSKPEALRLAAQYHRLLTTNVEVSGKDGGAIIVSDVSPLDIARRVAFLLHSGLPKP